ncbi:MAG: NAD(+)/NADH kinase [Planctomycetaceae bacterium]|jgi:NAD+ kinase|nr:NAD(+)/NADH kinase [Planctomycetaceae bacterium]
MNIILLGNGDKPGVREAVERLRPEIARRANILAEDFTGQQDVSTFPADLAIVFGGDGSILRAVSQMGTNQLPVLAVHLGTLSFLSTIQTDELIPLLDRPDLLQMPIIKHLLLHCQLFRKNQRGPESWCWALNEVVIHAVHAVHMLNIELILDKQLVTTYRCNGLIVSTPVGSTAMSLSSGGPILRKDIDAVVISPISPHTLSNRPLVDSPDRFMELRSQQPAELIVDGSHVALLEPGDTVQITRASQTFKTIDVPGFCYYKALRSKLGWNGRFES